MQTGKNTKLTVEMEDVSALRCCRPDSHPRFDESYLLGTRSQHNTAVCLSANRKDGFRKLVITTNMGSYNSRYLQSAKCV